VAQLRHTAHKFFSPGEGYVFGKADLLRILLEGSDGSSSTADLRHFPVWAWERLRGRFLSSYSGLKPLYFMWAALTETLNTQLFAAKLQRVVSSLTFQFHQPEMQIEVRVDVAYYNAILQPLQVVLGLNYFKIGEETSEEDLTFDRRLEGYFRRMQEAGEADAAVEPEPMVVESSSGEDESSGLCEASLLQRRRREGEAEVEARGKLAGVVEWWVGAPQKDLAAYVVKYSAEQRAGLADLVEAHGKHVLPDLVGGGDGATKQRQQVTKIARVVVDGRPGEEPLAPSERGMFYSFDVFESFIAACAALQDSPLLLFERLRPSVRLKQLVPDFNTTALEKLEAWEDHEYKQPARNAKGKELIDEQGQPVLRRDLEDELLCNPPAEMQRMYEKVHEGTEEELRCRYVRAQCVAGGKEMEKMNKKGLEGSMRKENRTLWQKQAVDPIAKNTMNAESGLAAMKQVRKMMQTGAYAREKARVNARMSRCWETLDGLSEEEQIVMLRVTNSLEKYFDAKDKVWLARHDRAATARRLRSLEEVIQSKAKDCANAKEYWKCKRFDGKGALKKELGKFSFKYEKQEVMMNQMDIITVGGDFGDLKFERGKKGEHCVVCGHANDNEFAHRVAHLTKCYKLIGKRGGWPKSPPRPNIVCKKLPPIGDVSEQTAGHHPVYRFIRRVEEVAAQRVDKGLVKADVRMVTEVEMPAIDASVVGRRIEYIFIVPVKIKSSGRLQNQSWCYRGTIQSVEQPQVGKRRGRKVPSVVVEWDEEEEGEDKLSAVLLEPEDWCQKRRDGWAVLDVDAGHSSKELTVLQKMDQHVLEVEMLVPKEEA
jgi:hypothetical protein